MPEAAVEGEVLFPTSARAALSQLAVAASGEALLAAAAELRACSRVALVHVALPRVPEDRGGLAGGVSVVLLIESAVVYTLCL